MKARTVLLLWLCAITPVTGWSLRAWSQADQLRVEAPVVRRARRGHATALSTYVRPLSVSNHPRLHSKATGSISVGTVSGGYLVNPSEIPLTGPHHRFLEGVQHRNTRFTTDELKAQVMCAAETVAKAHPGQLLHLGNFSQRSGGDFRWSVSHNSGRDADLAFLARRPNGSIIFPYHLYHYGHDLVARGGSEPMVFDVAANWTLVKALLTCDHATMTHMFVARWLKRAMLSYARAAKEPEELRLRAQRLLHQPRRAAAHNDHLHIRIACAADDISEGCLRPGRAPHAAIGQNAAVRARLPQLRRSLGSSSASTRAAAATLLGLYSDDGAASALKARLRDSAPAVRAAAATALRWVAPDRAAAWTFEALRHEGSREVASSMLDVLHHLEATEQLSKCLLDRRTLQGEVPLTIRVRAARLLATSRSLAAATQLVSLLNDDDALARRVAREGLERITNHSEIDLLLASAGSEFKGLPSAAQAVELWHSFLMSLPPGTTRDDVLLRGFALRGLHMETPSKQHLTQLAIALGWPAPYRDNAEELISSIVKYAPGVGRGSRVDPARYWRPWLSRRRKVRRAVLRDSARYQREQQKESVEVMPGFARFEWSPGL